MKTDYDIMKEEEKILFDSSLRKKNNLLNELKNIPIDVLTSPPKKINFILRLYYKIKLMLGYNIVK